MNNKLSPLVLIFTLTAVILGGTLGYFVPEFMLSISFIGKLFLNILKIITIPFAITMIIVGLSSMGSKEKVKRSLGKTALYFTSTSLTASLVGVLVALGIQPGINVLKDKAFIPEEIVPHLSNFSFNKLFGSFIPDNFLSASIEMQFFAVIIIALIFGTILTTVDRKDKIVLDFFQSLKQLLSSFMRIILYIAPIGLFSLSGTLFAENWQNSEILFSSLILFTTTIIFGLSFFALVVLPIIARMFSSVSPYSYFSTMVPALTTAFATNSAAATLPITEECIKQTTVDQRASAFMLPLGALFNSSGTALFLSAAAIFIAQLYGISLSVGQVLGVIGGSFIIATMTAFIPYASLFMVALVLDIANFPIHVTAGIGMLLLADFLFGRIRSVVDVWSDAVGVAVLGNTFDFKTARSAKAAIPVKRTYDKTKPKTTRDIKKSKTDYPKTKRVNKVTSQTKTATIRKNLKDTVKKETISKDTKSPFEIASKSNYLSETEKNNETTQQVKPATQAKPKTEQKKQKSPIVKHEMKVPRTIAQATKKDFKKIESSTGNTEQKKTEKTKPIIHKIEVPPLMAKPQSKVTPSPIQETLPVTEKDVAAEKPTIEVPALMAKPQLPTVPDLPSVSVKKKVPSEEETNSKKVSALLSQDTIERERAKIAAQLNLMREKESLFNISEEEVSIPTPVESEVQIDEKKQDKTPDNQFTKIDFYSGDEPNTPREDTEPIAVVENKAVAAETETAVESETDIAVKTETTTDEQTAVVAEETPVDVVPEETAAISFGRKSSKRATSKKTTDTAQTTEPAEPVKADKSDFAVDSMSFGRAKRKK